MNSAIVFDIIFSVILVVLTISCAAKGFVKKIMSIAALILSLLAAIFFFRTGAQIIRELLLPEMKTIPEIIAFILIFLIVFAVVKIVGTLLKKFVDFIYLGGVDHFLGAVFGFAQGLIIICLILLVIDILPFVDSGTVLRGSFFAKILMPFIAENRQEAWEALERVIWLEESLKRNCRV